MILTRRKVRERDVQCVCASKKKERACVLCRVSMCAFMHMRQIFKQAGNNTYILNLICILTCCFLVCRHPGSQTPQLRSHRPSAGARYFDHRYAGSHASTQPKSVGGSATISKVCACDCVCVSVHF